MSEFSSWDSGIEHSPLRARFGRKTRICIHCGGKTKRRIIKYIENSRTEETYRYCCLDCGQQTSPWSQFGYEDSKKRLNKIYEKLLEYVKPDQIKKIWIDYNDNYLDYEPKLDNLSQIIFLVTIDGTTFKIPCSYTKNLGRYYENPVGILKDKSYKKAFIDLKKHLGVK